MPWKISGFEEKHWYQSPLPWLGVTAAIGLLFLVLPRAQTLYRQWREHYRLQRAETAFGHGDFRRAMINAQMLLAKNPRSVEGLRVAAKSLEALHSPDAIAYRRRLNTVAADDVDNSLALAAASLEAGDPIAALRVLDSVPAKARTSARYHEVAAKTAIANGNFAEAESHWQDACRIEPANNTWQLEYAKIRLHSKSADARASAASALQQMVELPDQRLGALRALLRDAATYRERSRAREFADRLASDPKATFSDQLTRLAVLHVLGPNDFLPFLAHLQEISACQPADACQLLAWMNSNGLALGIPEWEARLPADTLASPPVRVELAEAYARASDWAKLKERLESESWKDLEFLRLAFISRTLERFNDTNGAAAAWNNSLDAAQGSPRTLEILAKAALNWGWHGRTQEVLWKLSSSRHCPRWAVEYLWKAASKASDTSKMYQASRLILRADPRNIAARNNHIALALLTGQLADSPYQLAKALYKEEPTNPIIATTYGFALYLQDRPWEAMAVINTFPSEQLGTRSTSLYAGLFMAATGQLEQARPYFEIAAKYPMLPEEKALVAKVTGTAMPAMQAGGIDRTRTDTLRMYNESRQKYLTEPQNITARTNYVLLALLTRQNPESARQLAHTLHQEHPDQAAAAITYGMSLYQQDRANEAVIAMESLDPHHLNDPLAAGYYGLFLRAAGQAQKAQKYLQLTKGIPLLAEEKALFEQAAP